MKKSEKITLIILLALVVSAVAGLFFTRSVSTTSVPGASERTATSGSQIVDQHNLQAAHRLAALAATPEETLLAQDAARTADHEVDLAFEAALEEATAAQASATAAAKATQTPEMRSLQERIAKIQSLVDSRQQALQQLTAAAKQAKGARLDDLQQQIQVAQAELDLFQDVLGDVKQDLERAGGDQRSTIQKLMEEHQAAEHAGAAPAADSATAASAAQPASLIAQWGIWSAARQKRSLIENSQQDAYSGAAALARTRDALQKQVAKEQAERNQQPLAELAATAGTGTPGSAVGTPALPGNQPRGTGTPAGAGRANSGRATSGTGGTPVLRPRSKEAMAAMAASLRQISSDQKNVAILKRRIENLEALGAIYGKWVALAQGGQRAALHGIIEYGFWIALTVFWVFLVSELVDRSIARLKLEEKRSATLRTITRTSAQVLAVLIVLLMIFGKPTQFSTVLGLATAGLAVVMKDFIVAFVGWFVLMGRNGVHVGDTVEINGVRGEVIEISLMRTLLLETGNWTETGHPTGRQVAFPNSYAIDGYYFNFNTSGQWLWDEFHVLIPANQNPYPIIEKIREVVSKETEANAPTAEREWQRVSRGRGTRSFTFQPTVNMKHAENGVDLTIRYIARAKERSEVRYRLNDAIVKLLHREPEFTSAPEEISAPTPVGPR